MMLLQRFRFFILPKRTLGYSVLSSFTLLRIKVFKVPELCLLSFHHLQQHTRLCSSNFTGFSNNKWIVAAKQSEEESDVEPQELEKKTRGVKRQTKKEAPEVDAQAPEKKTRKRAEKKEKSETTGSKTVKKMTKKDEPEVELEEPEKKSRAIKKSAKKEEPEVDPQEPAKKSRAKRAKKTEEVEPQEDEEEVDVKKERKRKAPASKKDEPATKPEKLNPTATKWDTLNFECLNKNSLGKSANFHVVSWNVDGLRAWLKKGGLDILRYANPDILCIQETKCGLEKIPDEVKNVEGYEALWCSSEKEGYAGVGVLTKVKPINVTYGIDSEEHDEEGRCITLEYETFFVVNVYVPNAGRKLVTLPKRLDWNELFKAHIKKLDKQKPVILCGDMNVAHEEIDLANPKTNKKNAGFTQEERDGMTDFLGDGYVDSFRHLYPEKEKVYTFWTYMANARAKNVGWRLDYFIVSERFLPRVCDQMVHREVLGSDHCPLSLHVTV